MKVKPSLHEIKNNYIKSNHKLFLTINDQEFWDPEYFHHHCGYCENKNHCFTLGGALYKKHKTI